MPARGDLHRCPAATYLPADVLAAIDAEANERYVSRAHVLREITIAHVRNGKQPRRLRSRAATPDAVDRTEAVG